MQSNKSAHCDEKNKIKFMLAVFPIEICFYDFNM